MIDNCRIVCEDSNSITIEIDLTIHDKLLQDVTRKIFTKKLGTRKFEKKANHAYIVGNPYLTLEIYSCL